MVTEYTSTDSQETKNANMAGLLNAYIAMASSTEPTTGTDGQPSNLQSIYNILVQQDIANNSLTADDPTLAEMEARHDKQVAKANAAAKSNTPLKLFD